MTETFHSESALISIPQKTLFCLRF